MPFLVAFQISDFSLQYQHTFKQRKFIIEDILDALSNPSEQMNVTLIIGGDTHMLSLGKHKQQVTWYKYKHEDWWKPGSISNQTKLNVQ